MSEESGTSKPFDFLIIDEEHHFPPAPQVDGDRSISERSAMLARIADSGIVGSEIDGGDTTTQGEQVMIGETNGPIEDYSQNDKPAINPAEELHSLAFRPSPMGDVYAAQLLGRVTRAKPQDLEKIVDFVDPAIGLTTISDLLLQAQPTEGDN